MGWSAAVSLNRKCQGTVGLAALPDGGLVYVGVDPATYKLRFSIWRDGAWDPDRDLGAHYSAAGAAVGTFQGRVFCAHRGAGTFNEDTKLYWTVYDPASKKWSADAHIDNAFSRFTPALAEFTPFEPHPKPYLYCVHRSGDVLDKRLWYTMYDGVEWTRDATLSEISEHGTALALSFHRDAHEPRAKLYCLHDEYGKSHEHPLNFSIHNGHKWVGPLPIPDRYAHTLCASFHDEKLYCVHTAPDPTTKSGHFFWMMVHDGKQWSSDERMPIDPGQNVYGANPAMAWQNGIMHFIYPYHNPPNVQNTLYHATYTPD